MQQLAQRPLRGPVNPLGRRVLRPDRRQHDDGRLGGQVVADGLLVAEPAVEEGDDVRCEVTGRFSKCPMTTLHEDTWKVKPHMPLFWQHVS